MELLNERLLAIKNMDIKIHEATDFLKKAQASPSVRRKSRTRRPVDEEPLSQVYIDRDHKQ